MDREKGKFRTYKKVILFLSDGGDCDSAPKRTESLKKLLKDYKDTIREFRCVMYGNDKHGIDILTKMSN